MGTVSEYTLDMYLMRSIEIYIGNEPNWYDNPKCDGGPYLSDNFEDYFDPLLNKMVPSYGFEAFCNMPGRYTFFVASGVPSFNVFICSLGVMGTRYLRD